MLPGREAGEHGLTPPPWRTSGSPVSLRQPRRPPFAQEIAMARSTADANAKLLGLVHKRELLRAERSFLKDKMEFVATALRDLERQLGEARRRDQATPSR
jgi:hypothetical protein